MMFVNWKIEIAGDNDMVDGKLFPHFADYICPFAEKILKS
jgi:hypothetical protein